MLTQKIAYQIASGLAYLHKKNIIFCDLKSDNILVWSLDIKEHIIQLSGPLWHLRPVVPPKGALGVEGTPGYQATEIPASRIVARREGMAHPQQSLGPGWPGPRAPAALGSTLPQAHVSHSLVLNREALE